MQASFGNILQSPDLFDKLCEENSISKVTAFIYSGGDLDEEVCEEPKVSKQSSDMVREFLRSKVLSVGKQDV